MTSMAEPAEQAAEAVVDDADGRDDDNNVAAREKARSRGVITLQNSV